MRFFVLAGKGGTKDNQKTYPSAVLAILDHLSSPQLPVDRRGVLLVESPPPARVDHGANVAREKAVFVGKIAENHLGELGDVEDAFGRHCV